MTEMTKVEMFTDGSCRGNPGPGGWGVLIRAGGREKGAPGEWQHELMLPRAATACQADGRSVSRSV